MPKAAGSARRCRCPDRRSGGTPVLTSLVNIETLLAERFKGDGPMFIRIGKKYIVNKQYIFQINIPRQRLVLTDYQTPGVLEISVSKDALRNLKQLYSK